MSSQETLVHAMVGDSEDPSTKAFADAVAKYAFEQMRVVSAHDGPDVASTMAMMALRKWLVTTCKTVCAEGDAKGTTITLDGRVGGDGTHQVDGAFLTIQGVPFRLELGDLSMLADVFEENAKPIKAQIKRNKAEAKAEAVAAKAERKAAREEKKAASVPAATPAAASLS